MIDAGKRNVLGINVNVIDYAGAVERIVRAALNRRGLSVSALAVHGLMTGVQDPEHKYRLNAFDLLVPDGQPVRWALNVLHGTALADRVYGPNLMLDVCARAARESLPIYLFGGSCDLLAKLRARLSERYPDLRICGCQRSRFRQLSSHERDDLVEQIRASGAAITFVGLGCPRQEVWIYECRDRLSMPLLAVGAAFNFHAGELSQAPVFLQRRGLEWLYRLTCEPKRLWQRYLLLNPTYVALLTGQALGVFRPNPQAAQPPTREILYG
jgi:hypothetical protein